MGVAGGRKRTQRASDDHEQGLKNLKGSETCLLARMHSSIPLCRALDCRVVGHPVQAAVLMRTVMPAEHHSEYCTCISLSNPSVTSVLEVKKLSPRGCNLTKSTKPVEGSWPSEHYRKNTCRESTLNWFESGSTLS